MSDFRSQAIDRRGQDNRCQTPGEEGRNGGSGARRFESLGYNGASFGPGKERSRTDV
jgi:hypothetical protein